LRQLWEQNRPAFVEFAGEAFRERSELMDYQYRSAELVVGRPALRAIFMPFPVACFTLTLLTDIFFWQTSNLLWSHFSSWLLLAGVVFGALAALAGVVDLLVGRLRAPDPVWPLAIGGAVVLALAFVNSLVHAGDGWTAVVPYGLILSAVTVVVMAVIAWFCRAPVYRYDVEVRHAE
jgi:uncharacterized membrane protein